MRTVVAVVTAELMTRWESLLATIVCVKSSRHLGHRERCALVVGTVAVGTSRETPLCIVFVAVNPRLSERVEAVRSTVGCNRNIRVADTAFCDLGDVALGLLGINVVIVLQTGILRVWRTVTGGTENSSVPGTEPI